jgi:hypothetical protein
MSETNRLSAKELEELRLYLLIRAAEAGRDGITLDLLFLSSKLQGFNCEVEHIRAECQYLADLKFLVEIADTLCKGHKKFRIYATGRDYLEHHGFPSS